MCPPSPCSSPTCFVPVYLRTIFLSHLSLSLSLSLYLSLSIYLSVFLYLILLNLNNYIFIYLPRGLATKFFSHQASIFCLRQVHSAPKYSSTISRSTLFSYLCRMADSNPSPFPQALSVPAHRSLHQRVWTKKVGHCLATLATGGQRQSVLVPSRTFYISRVLSL